MWHPIAAGMLNSVDKVDTSRPRVTVLVSVLLRVLVGLVLSELSKRPEAWSLHWRCVLVAATENPCNQARLNAQVCFANPAPP